MLEALHLFFYGVSNFLLLFSLGIAGWALFAFIRSPVPALLGTLTVVGTLRAIGAPIPMAPEYVSPIVQVMLGIYIGTIVTRDTVRQLKSLVLPALLVSLWALALVFAFGRLLSRLTWLDTYTAVLSSSVGGLPEMMVLSIATGADVAVVIVMQAFRLLATVALFPLLFQRMFGLPTAGAIGFGARTARVNGFFDAARDVIGYFSDRPHRLLFSLVLAAAGGWVFTALGVPAGIMVGAMFACAGASIAGLPVRPFHPRLFNLLMIAVGIMVTDHFGPRTAETVMSGDLLWPLLLSTCVIFFSSLGVAGIIHRLCGWDLPTSFLAAAPGGFTVMTMLAIQYGRDPFRVSMVHLARLLAIKAVVPFVFMLLV